MNSISEFNRCRVPRLKINQEEWGLRRAVDKKTGTTVGMASIQEEEQATQESEEAEVSLADGSPIKRKKENPQKGRQEKRRKLDKLVGSNHPIIHPGGRSWSAFQDQPRIQPSGRV